MQSLKKRNQRIALRWLLYFLLLLLAAALQTTPGFLAIGMSKAYFIPAVCLAVAIREGEYYGALFGAAGGLLWDYTGGRTIGLLAILLLLLCFGVSLLVQAYLKPTWVNFMLLNGACGLLTMSLDHLFFYLMRGYSNAGARYLFGVLPEVVISAILSPIFFRAVTAIYNALDTSDE